MNYFDLHCDSVSEALNKKKPLKNGDMCVSLDKATGFDVWRQCFALFIPDELHGEAAYKEYKRLFAFYKEQLSLFKDDDTPILTVENATALGGKLERVEELALDGVKMMGLTWNAENELGFGAGTSGGRLKQFGKEVIKQMRRCRITVDVSHLSDESLNDLLAYCDFPVVASHSNLRSVCDNKRNLTDEQFKDIASRGGLVGLNLHVPFLTKEKDATKEDLYRQVDRMLLLGGEKCMAMGTDFDGGIAPAFCRDISCVKGLYDDFAKRYGKAATDRIFYTNAFDFFLK